VPDAQQPAAPDAAPAPGKERHDHAPYGEDDEGQGQHRTEKAPRQAAAEAFDRLASQERVHADEGRGPDRHGEREVEAEAEQTRAQDAGCETRRQPRSGQEPADQDDDKGSPAQPRRGFFEPGFTDPPLEGRQPESRPSQDTREPGDAEVAAQDADVAGGDGDREVEPALGHEQAGRDAGQVLAGVRGEHEEQEDDQQGRPGERRQVQVVERQCRPP